MRLICIALLLAACKEPTAPRDFFGKQVVPPMGLDRIRPGMTRAEAQAALPTLKKHPYVKDMLEVPTGVRDVELMVEGDPVSRIFADVKSPLARDLDRELVDDWKDAPAAGYFRGASWIAEVMPHTREFATIEFWPRLDIKQMFAGGAASLPPVFARLKPGMTKHEIETVLPRFVAKSSRLPEEHTSFTLYGDLEPTGLEDISIYLTQDHRDALLALWGPGEIGEDDSTHHESHTWYAPATGWRATYMFAAPSGELPKKDRLSYDRYMPLHTLLGDGPDLAMVASSPWGKKVDEVAKDFPTLHGTSNLLTLPPTEAGPRIGHFVVDAIGKIDTLVVRFICGTKCDTLAAAFAQKWPGAKGDVYHATNPYVRIQPKGAELVMTYRPTPPLNGAAVQ